MRSVRLDDDRAVAIRAKQPQARDLLQRGHRFGVRVPIVVVCADGDDCDPRLELLQLLGETQVGGAVVRNLEDLDRR